MPIYVNDLGDDVAYAESTYRIEQEFINGVGYSQRIYYRDGTNALLSTSYRTIDELRELGAAALALADYVERTSDGTSPR